MRINYYELIANGETFTYSFLDEYVDAENNPYHLSHKHKIKIFRKYKMRNDLFRVYKKEIESLNGAELFIVDK